MDKLNFNSSDYTNLFSDRSSWLDRETRFVLESGDEEDEEVELHSDLEDKVNDERSDEEETTEEDIEVSSDNDDNEYDLSEFGNHGGPDVPNNQYNEKDVEILNKLVASESDAINDYFEATKNTSDDHLSHLYGDIGAEERFHLEQLLYAKSLITGEKYEPKDPEVKKEYEELIGDGMDEDTAICTVIDKLAINRTDMSDDEVESLKEDIAETESYLIQSEILTEMICESDTNIYPQLVQEYANRIDIYMEDVLNVNTLSKQERYGTNPLKWIVQQFWRFINFLRKLGKLVREYLARGRAKRNRIHAYIKKYGISAIFQQGYSFYMYDDAKGEFDTNAIIKSADAIYKTMNRIADSCGLEIKLQNPLSDDMYGKNTIPISSVDQGIKFINGIILTKTRVNVNDNNEEYLKNFLFGYSSDKIVSNVKDADAAGNAIIKKNNLSNNFYNRSIVLLEHLTLAGQYASALATKLNSLEGDPNSIYRKNYDTWKKSVSYMKDVMKGFSKLIAAVNHDINTMTKIDEYVLSLTQTADQAAQSGKSYTGDLRRTTDIPKPTNEDLTNTIIGNKR